MANMNNLSCDDDSVIDFDFFETEGDQIKKYNIRKESDSSKIVTKAVIETNRLNFSVDAEQAHDSFDRKFDMVGLQPLLTCEENLYLNLGLPSSNSSLEKRLLDDASLNESLLNCLAYNDDGKRGSNSYLLDGDIIENWSDSSLTESTVTSITSDITSVSPLLSLPDSGCSDESADSFSSLIPPNENEDDFRDSDMIDQTTQISLPRHATEQSDTVSVSDEDNSNNTMSNNNSYGSNEDYKSCNENDTEGEELNECESTKPIPNLFDEKSNISVLEDELGDISLAAQSSSASCSLRTEPFRGINKMRIAKKEHNLTFSREELIKIERENLILLKKIMTHSKPRTLSLGQSLTYKKTSAAINRARQQKKIEQDNYILYSKISALGRMKRVF